MENLPRTYAEAKVMGYAAGRESWQRGYVSRKANIDNQPVHIAGGKMKGKIYILAPSWRSSQYCKRIYLIKK